MGTARLGRVDMERAVELILLRHTRVDLPEGICYGASDVGLAAGYEQTFAKIANGLPTGWGRLLASPLQRCRLLADHLAGDQTVETDERLQEINFGDWELQRWDDISPAAYRSWGEDWVRSAPPGGESMEVMAQRVQACLREAIAVGKNMLVVSHGGPIRTILADLQGLSLREAAALPVDRGHHFHLRLVDGQWAMLAMNCAPGL